MPGPLTENLGRRAFAAIGGAIVSAFGPSVVPDKYEPWLVAFGLLIVFSAILWPYLEIWPGRFFSKHVNWRFLRSNSAGEEIARLTERLKRIEERQDGAVVVAGALDTRKNPKPLRLSRAEQERVTDRLIKLDDYLTGDLAGEIQPFIDLMDWSEFLRFNGGAALHEKVEAPRIGLSDRIMAIAQKLKVFEEDTAVLNLRPLYIKTRMLPLEGALFDMSCVSEMLPADSINNAPLRLLGRNYNQVVLELKDEVARVRRDIADWRGRIARGELG